MSQTPLKQTPNARPIDPNILQNRASQPNSSVWVAASAGSGKTKVLTDRILRLLLPNQDSSNACPPHKILALTFTKAAASEMSLRIHKRLSEWATMDLEGKEGLIENLKSLLGSIPTQEQTESARKLFAGVVDTPGGLKVMTIHSFCQSILGRFPLEADLTPGFKALEENQASLLLKQAQRNVFSKGNKEKGSPLSEAIHNLTLSQNEEQFSRLLQNLISERRQLQTILEKHFGTEGLYSALCEHLNIAAGKTEDDLLYEACDNNNFDKKGLWEACKNLSEGTEKTDQPKGLKIQNWLEKDQKERLKSFDSYKKIFLTANNTVLKTLATAKIKKSFPDTLSTLEAESLRVYETLKEIKSIKIARLTHSLFLVGEEILEQYQTLKIKAGALDFDDLILKTLDLLQGNTNNMKGLEVSPWVRYKLDQGIDHLLVDEAQDTNPEQWQIIAALTDDFFDSHSEQDTERTLFVVGDQKQSIFSFQRASPEKFNEMRKWLKNKISPTTKSFEEINFNVSFRSVKSVLQLVDAIFSTPDMQEGLDTSVIQHEAFRYTQAGKVELWPIFENPKKEEFDPWEPPTKVIDSSSGAAQMASHIGNTISQWLEKEEILESYNRPINAGDIMILVRSRTAFIDQLVRALKIRNIPVSGVDRMVLSQQLVVQDLCATAQFSLLPEDDLTLACLLKSPFIGWNEEKLFDICYNRKQKSLWSSLKEKSDTKTISWLENLIYMAGKLRPYEFLSHILQTPCPAHTSGRKAIKSRLGDESLDPLDEFLNRALDFEKENIPTLQNFIQAQLHDEKQIKRQMEEAGNAVRIMTVHAAKGLQSPIVILPDTTRTSASAKADRILWPDKTGAVLPYFCPVSTNFPQPINDAIEKLKVRLNEEYKRLLYVALTRAESRLYIGGYAGSKKISENCWYNYVKRGFENLPDVKITEENDKKILRYSNPATAKPDRTDKNIKEKKNTLNKVPDWLFTPIQTEPFPPRPLIPSRPSESETPALSPLKSMNESRFLRGNITHKLLQILPDLPPEKRKEAAQNYVSQPIHDLSEKIQKSIINETLAILENSKFAKIFGIDSMAEVPVTGLLNNKTLVSGQIDRLLITDHEILIIDYKTNRPPPADVKDVPLIYKNQMKAYTDLMRHIYPNRKIRAAFIWTDGATLMELPDL